jgi:NitT/TauT family transport system substrate-binding protein
VDGMGPAPLANNEMRRLLTTLLITLLLGCHRSETRVGIQTVRVAIHRDPVVFLPFRIAQTLGYYRQEGLEVQTPEVAGGAKAIEALLGRSVDVAAGSLSDAVQLVAQGRDVRCFLVLYSRPTVALAVAPKMNRMIRSIRDLKGRTIGVSAPGSASQQFLNFLLVSNGISPQDVSTVSVGMSGSSIAALEYGKVDAAVLIASAITNFEERHPGSPFLADSRSASGARQIFGSEIFPSLSLLAQESWLRDHSDCARRLVRALKKGMQWMQQHPAEQVRQMVRDDVKAETDLRAIRQAQEVLSSDGLVPVGSAEMIERFLELSNPKGQPTHIDVAKAYTNAFASPN